MTKMQTIKDFAVELVKGTGAIVDTGASSVVAIGAAAVVFLGSAAIGAAAVAAVVAAVVADAVAVRVSYHISRPVKSRPLARKFGGAAIPFLAAAAAGVVVYRAVLPVAQATSKPAASAAVQQFNITADDCRAAKTVQAAQSLRSHGYKVSCAPR